MKPFQLLLSLLFCLAATKSLGAPGADFADDVEVTVLSTNLANDGTRGEWGVLRTYRVKRGLYSLGYGSLSGDCSPERPSPRKGSQLRDEDRP